MDRMRVVSWPSAVGLALALVASPLSAQAAGTGAASGAKSTASADTASARPAASRSDSKDKKDLREDLQELSADNFAEVEAGKVARQQASSSQVKSFAQQMIDDHGKAGAELAALARKKGIDLAGEKSTERAESHMETLEDLKKKTGAEFDLAYMKQMEEDHEDVEENLRELARDTKDPELKAFFEKTRATVAGHLTHARSARMALVEADREQKAAAARTADPAASGMGAAEPSGANTADPASAGTGAGLGAPPEPAPGPAVETTR